MAGFRSGSPVAAADRLPILMYHSLTPAVSSTDPLRVPVRLFAAHLEILAALGYRTVGLTEALGIRAEEPEARVVAVTVDDGYVDFLLCLDLLEQFDARVTLYLPTALVGTGATLHRTATRLLTWREVAALPVGRVELGSHAATHVPLDVQHTPALERELVSSREVLRVETGSAPRSLAYPHGYASRAVARAARAAGYTNACIVGRRVARLADDSFRLPRLQVLPQPSPDAFLRLLESGEPGLRPFATRALAAPWRSVRQAAYRTTGMVLT